MSKRLETELKVGVFVTLGITLIMIAILLLGSTEKSPFKQTALFPALQKR